MLTNDQRRALASDHHVSVTANAGTGKTTVLVERYLELLRSGTVLPSAIVVVTFTEKAAGELKLRIADRLAAASTVASPVEAGRLSQERRDLAGAFIGTIHAFCAHTLREFPVEAGVDASFSVIEGLDQRLMLAEAVHETMRRVMQDTSPGPPLEALQDLLHEKGRGELYRIVTVLVENRGILEQLTGRGGLYNRSDKALLAFWRDNLLGQLDAALRDPFLLESLARLVESASGRNAAAAGEMLQDLTNAGNLAGRVTAYETLVGLMLRKDGRLSAAFRGKGSERRRSSVWETAFLAQHRRISPLLPLVLAPREAAGRQLDLLRASRLLLSLAQEAMERYEQRKLETARLDFEDLLLRTKYLMRNEAVRRHLAERYRYIMVDEYQDTNLLQYEILLPLVNNLREGNLFIVGDPKQSIYAFRGADVTVFERTRNDIAAAAGRDADVLLAQSFRPLRDIAAFVNLVFSRAMTGAEFDVRYDALVRARNNGAPGSVELLLANPDDPDGASEGESIARRILTLRAEHATVFDRTEQERPMRFGDVGVLLRSRAVLADIEAAFIRHRVPYTVTAGTGFFQTQEVADLYSYLRFLTYPEDDVALVALLRSPFFGVSDTGLFSVAHKRPPGDLWTFLAQQPGEIAVSLPLREAVRILREDLRDSVRFPVHELITRVLDRTQYPAKHAGALWGEQTLANLEKLQEVARAFDRQGFVGLRDFVVRLRSFMEEEQNEGQGVAEMGRDAVRVMTVHAAKGQEFPVVILPRLRAATQSDREPFIDPFWGIGVMPPGVEGQEEDEPPLTGFLRFRNRRRTLAEEKRVFYVACTRARDRLILSADGIDTGGRETPMTWIAAALEIDGEDLPSVIERHTVTDLLLHEESQATAREEHPLRIAVLQGASLPSLLETGAGLSSIPSLSDLLVEPLQPTPSGEMYDLEEIVTYRACPHLYHMVYHLGLPPAAGEMREEAVRLCRSWLRRSALWHASQRADERRDGVVIIVPLANALVRVRCERIFVSKDGQVHAIVLSALLPGLVAVSGDAVPDVLTGIVASALASVHNSQNVQFHITYLDEKKKCRILTGMAEKLRDKGEQIFREVLQGLRGDEFHHPVIPCPTCTRLTEQTHSRFTSSTL